MVGTFSKSPLAFGRVSAFAHRVWKNRGLLSVSQKDNSTFIFKFDTEVHMNNVLAQGTWYIDSGESISTKSRLKASLCG